VEDREDNNTWDGQEASYVGQRRYDGVGSTARAWSKAQVLGTGQEALHG
jgi:hypothetical protein